MTYNAELTQQIKDLYEGQMEEGFNTAVNRQQEFLLKKLCRNLLSGRL